MLGAVVVHLHRQLGARLHRDALDLVTRPGIHRIVFAPRAVHLAVNLVLGAALGLDLRHDLLNLTDPITRRHQHRVLGLHHHMVLQTHRGHQSIFGKDQVVLAVMREHIAPVHIARRIVRQHLPQSGKRAHIAPARVHGHHHCGIGFFHHRHIDRHVRTSPEGLGIHPHKIHVGLGRRHGLAASRQNVRAVRLQFGQIPAGAKQKHAAVPVVIAAGHILLGHSQGRLFNKGRHLESPLAHRRATQDVAITRLGPVRHDAKGHQSPRLGQRQSFLHRRLKRAGVLNQVICRQHQEQRIGPVRRGPQRRQSHGRRCVATGRLQHHVALQGVHLAQLLGHQKAVVFVANDQRLRHRQTCQPRQRGLQHRLLRTQGQKLLGKKLTRQRPQTRAGAAGQDDGTKWHGGKNNVHQPALACCIQTQSTTSPSGW